MYAAVEVELLYVYLTYAVECESRNITETPHLTMCSNFGLPLFLASSVDDFTATSINFHDIWDRASVTILADRSLQTSIGNIQSFQASCNSEYDDSPIIQITNVPSFDITPAAPRTNSYLLSVVHRIQR